MQALYPPWQFCSNCLGLFSLLSSLSPSFRVLIPDVQKLVDQSMPREGSSHRQVSGGYVYTKYHPMEEVKKSLSLLVYFIVFCYVNATAGNSMFAESSAEQSVFLTFFFKESVLTFLLNSNLVELNMNLPLILIKSSIFH